MNGSTNSMLSYHAQGHKGPDSKTTVLFKPEIDPRILLVQKALYGQRALSKNTPGHQLKDSSLSAYHFVHNTLCKMQVTKMFNCSLNSIIKRLSATINSSTKLAFRFSDTRFLPRYHLLPQWAGRDQFQWREYPSNSQSLRVMSALMGIVCLWETNEVTTTGVSED